MRNMQRVDLKDGCGKLFPFSNTTKESIHKSIDILSALAVPSVPEGILAILGKVSESKVKFKIDFVILMP